MNNLVGTQGVPLNVFGGAVVEMDPEDLPEGASPFNQDCDYSPGSVFCRGGRVNQIGSFNIFLEKICTVAQNGGLPGVAWTSPSNATLNVPATPAAVTLNVGSGFGFGGYVDSVTTANGNSANLIVSATPTTANEYALLIGNAGSSITAPGGWSAIYTTGHNFANVMQLSGGPVNINLVLSGPTFAWIGQLVFFGSNGAPVIVQTPTIQTASGVPIDIAYTSANTAGNTLFAMCNGVDLANDAVMGAITDTNGNTWQLLTSTVRTNDGSLGFLVSVVYVCFNCKGGANTVHFTPTANNTNSNLCITEISGITTIPATAPSSQFLQGSAFNLSIPVGVSVLGMQIEATGTQSDPTPTTGLQATIVNGTAATPVIFGQLPSVSGTIQLGAPNQNWGLALTPALLNSPTFAVEVQAVAPGGAIATFNVSALKLKVFLSPSPPANFNWMKTYEQTSGQVDTLALDSNGILWDENVSSLPGTMSSIFLNILPNTYAKGVTFNDIEYIAFSNLINGTDIPRQWNGTNLDRLSMVGPGAPPTAASSTANNTIVSITQNPIKSDPLAPGHLSGLLWSGGPGSSQPGNVVTVYYAQVGALPAGDPTLVVGGNVALTGLGGTNSIPQLPNGVYTITSVGQGVPPGASATRWYFTFQMPTSLFNNQADHIESHAPNGFYQVTLATMTTQTQVPNLSVGNQFQITGTGGSPPAGYDGPWTVVGTPNSAQLQITSTQLNGGIATYSYILISGTAPIAGQFINVTNTLNGGGIFNVTNTAIYAASAGSFSIAIAQPNVSPAAENGSGIIFGTIFTFDPLQIVGNKTGGSIASVGIIGVGIRKVCYSFLTRTGQITQPSPITTFNVLAGAGTIVVSGILPGPPNVVARIISFTGANGGNFFNIPQPVTVISNGTPIVNSSTWINDNVTTTATLSFSDGVLLAATAIDIPGNNLFADMELGSCRGLITYAERMIAWGEQNKIMNLRNLSFDGGIAGTTQGGGSTTTYPPGWTVDPTSGGGVSLVNSPIFGFAVQIQNTSGSTQATYGMLTQPAYQDEFLVPIVQSALAYSVRVTASCPTGAAGGNLVVDLFSPSFNQVFGSFSVPLTSMTSNMAIFTGTLLTSPFAQVPKDLLIRMYATAIPNNVTIQMDRCEPFPTRQPSFSVQLRSSYVLNPEAFDLVTGAFGPAQNQQPINGVMTMYDLLYALKERSWYSTSDNGVTEPNKWNWKEVSSKVGTIGINSYDYGEGWALTGNREGVFFFEGGEPIKVSQEIQPLWDMINWSAGSSVWVRNDPEQKRFTVGVPISTPNVFMPEFPVNKNPTTPNVILMCNYRELNTGAAMAQTGPIKSTFSGRLISPEPARKWSFWNIRSPYSDYIDRADNNWPQWFGTGYSDSKIFALDGATLSDDGNAINSFYVTYGFVNAEVAESRGVGLYRTQLGYFTVLAVGVGNLNTYVYPESPLNQPYVLDQVPLPTISAGDLELAVNIKGQRFFVRVGTNSVGSTWRLSKMIVALSQDAWSPIRGLSSATP